MGFMARLREERILDMFVLIQYEVCYLPIFCKTSFLCECETFSLALRDGRMCKLEAFKTK